MTIATTGDALYQAIVDEPEDDDLRLIYADWLQDRDDDDRRDAALAEFIRLQCRLARPYEECACEATATDEDPLCPACLASFAEQDAMLLRENELLRYNASYWIDTTLPNALLPGFGRWTMRGRRLRSHHSVCQELEFNRGFVGTVSLSANDWAQHRVELVRRLPLECVKLPGRVPLHTPHARTPCLRGRYSWRVYAPVADYAVGSEFSHFLPVDLLAESAQALQLVDGIWSAHDSIIDARKWLSTMLLTRARALRDAT